MRTQTKVIFILVVCTYLIVSIEFQKSISESFKNANILPIFSLKLGSSLSPINTTTTTTHPIMPRPLKPRPLQPKSKKNTKSSPPKIRTTKTSPKITPTQTFSTSKTTKTKSTTTATTTTMRTTITSTIQTPTTTPTTTTTTTTTTPIQLLQTTHIKTTTPTTNKTSTNKTAAAAAASHAPATPPPTKAVTADDIYPSQDNDNGDRILEQLRFIPRNITPVIGIYSTGVPEDQQDIFKKGKCTVSNCFLSTFEEADVVISKHGFMRTSPHQILVASELESASHIGMSGTPNWTASYRHDSTIVAPYERFVPYDDRVLTQPQTRNFAHNKTKKVAWFVSNCHADNNRLEYAQNLSDYIQVDIYGGCGRLNCYRHQDRCLTMLETDYKFYLAFENSNCRDYITEKFYVNALNNTVLPIVMGAAPEDYRRVAPPNSFIHVDDFPSPRHLADYLHLLDGNDTLYNEYFQWKGTGDFINTLFLCRVCALAHDAERRGPSWYTDIERWWGGPGVCIGDDYWRNHPRRAGEMIGELPGTKEPSRQTGEMVGGVRGSWDEFVFQEKDGEDMRHIVDTEEGYEKKHEEEEEEVMSNQPIRLKKHHKEKTVADLSQKSPKVQRLAELSFQKPPKAQLFPLFPQQLPKVQVATPTSSKATRAATRPTYSSKATRAATRPTNSSKATRAATRPTNSITVFKGVNTRKT